MLTPEQIGNALQVLGVTGLLAFALLAFYKGWVVTGAQYRAKEKEADEWKAMAIDGLRTAGDIAQAARQHTLFTPEEADVALRVIREAKRRES